MEYPPTREEPVKENFHGVTVVDSYRWLEESTDEVKAWDAKQTELAIKVLREQKSWKPLHDEFRKLIDIEKMGVLKPRELPDGRWRYFRFKREPGKTRYSLFSRDGLGGKDRVVLDPSSWDKGKDTDIGDAFPSDNGLMAAYFIEERGGDRMQIRIVDVESKKDLPDIFSPVRFPGLVWGNDNKGFYYTKWPEPGVDQMKQARIWYHEVGTNQIDDVPIFGENLDEKVICDLSLSESSSFLLIYVDKGPIKTDVYYKDVGEREVRPLIVGKDANFYATTYGNIVYLQTNYRADRYRLVKFDIANPEEKNWIEVIPEEEDLLGSISIIDGKIVAKHLVKGVGRLRIYTLEGQLINEVELPGMGHAFGPHGRRKSKEFFINFSSFTQPETIYRYDMEKDELTEIDRVKIDIDPEKYEVGQVWCDSKDKTKVPMFLVHKKGLKLDGNNPTLLSGYGGFGLIETPNFNSDCLPFLERGGVLARPSLRGDGTLGKSWHRAGTLEQKQNTFDDFIAAAEWLIEKGYTRKERLAILGGSNGGLLVGACMVQRPDLFKAVVCAVPVLDMLRYHHFHGASLWIPEYGSAENKEQFEFLRKYSPYHNLEERDYPAVLFITAENDTRVAPMHARKMAAKLQKVSKNPVFLRIELGAGHAGGSALDKSIEEDADFYSFLFWQLGMD